MALLALLTAVGARPAAAQAGEHTEFALYSVTLAAGSDPSVAPAAPTVTWTLASRAPSPADGVLEATLDGHAIVVTPSGSVHVDAGAQLSGALGVYALGAGEHALELSFFVFTGGSHIERRGPTGTKRVPNRELAASRSLALVVLAAAPPAIACNGDARLCDRRYDEVSFATTHNAYDNEDEHWILRQQQHGIRKQLDDGIRALMLDVHMKDGTPYLCHTGLCLDVEASTSNPTLDWGLVQVREFLRDNPREVATLILESDVLTIVAHQNAPDPR